MNADKAKQAIVPDLHRGDLHAASVITAVHAGGDVNFFKVKFFAINFDISLGGFIAGEQQFDGDVPIIDIRFTSGFHFLGLDAAFPVYPKADAIDEAPFDAHGFNNGQVTEELR